MEGNVLIKPTQTMKGGIRKIDKTEIGNITHIAAT